MASLIPKVNATTGSATAPGAGALVTGELAENKFTGRLYVKTESAAVVDPARVTLSGDVTGSTDTATSEAQGGTIPCVLNTVAVSKGGTGLIATPANGQILIGNGTGYTLATLTAGSNVSITNTAGAITINSNYASSGITSGIAVPLTNQTSVDFTGIPSTAKIITVMFDGLSTDGSSTIQIQFGTSSSFENTGYVSGNVFGTITSGFLLAYNPTPPYLQYGTMVLTQLTGNNWIQNGNSLAFGVAVQPTCGSKTLASTLTRLRLTTVNGTDQFDAGTVNIMWQF
jgi:hypothetical protein